MDTPVSRTEYLKFLATKDVLFTISADTTFNSINLAGLTEITSPLKNNKEHLIPDFIQFFVSDKILLETSYISDVKKVVQ